MLLGNFIYFSKSHWGLFDIVFETGKLIMIIVICLAQRQEVPIILKKAFKVFVFNFFLISSMELFGNVNLSKVFGENICDASSLDFNHIEKKDSSINGCFTWEKTNCTYGLLRAIFNKILGDDLFPWLVPKRSIYRKSIVGLEASSKGKIFYASIIYSESLPLELSSLEKSKFVYSKKKINGETKDVYTYIYNTPGKLSEKTMKELEIVPPPKKSLIKKLQTAFKRFFGDSAKPQSLSIEECAEFINQKPNVLILTGAGISLAANISTMQKIQEDLGVKDDKLVDSFVKTLLSDPKKTIDVLENFFELSAKKENNVEATPAHYAITDNCFAKKHSSLNRQF